MKISLLLHALIMMNLEASDLHFKGDLASQVASNGEKGAFVLKFLDTIVFSKEIDFALSHKDNHPLMLQITKQGVDAIKKKKYSAVVVSETDVTAADFKKLKSRKIGVASFVHKKVYLSFVDEKGDKIIGLKFYYNSKDYKIVF